MTNKNKPEIRFPGFTEEWEQRKLGELTDEFKSGYSIKAENIFDKGEYPVYGGNGIRGFTDTFNHDGEFALIGRQGALSGNMNFSTDKAYFTEHAIAVRANNMNDTRFLYFLLCKLQLGRWVTQSAQPGLAVGTLVEIRTQVPGKAKEQQKIGNFFKQLDDTIALHQRELELLKETKKGFLQKMFPKEGEKVPEIRFPGFTEEWEQRKLGELANIVRGASPRPIQDPKWFDTESDVGWLRISDVTEQDGRIHYLKQRISKLGQEKTRVLTEPHLLLSIAATVGKPVVNYVKTGVHDGFLIFLNPIFEREFIFQWLEMFRPKWQKYGQPGSQVNLNSELVRNQEISLPSGKEQQKIGAFFKQFDDIIALHQRELDLLKETKKGFLQKLFV